MCISETNNKIVINLIDLAFENTVSLQYKMEIKTEFLSQKYVILQKESFSFDKNFISTICEYLDKGFSFPISKPEVIPDIEILWQTGRNRISQIIEYLIQPVKRARIDLHPSILRFLVQSNFISVDDDKHVVNNVIKNVTSSGINFVMNTFDTITHYILM